MTRAAVFFDRDGVVNELVPDPVSGLPESPLDPADVVLAPGAAAALRTLRDAGFVLVAVSNQPAAAKGTVTREQLHAVHERVVELLEREGVTADDWRYCFHHPQGTDPELRTACDCRKPAPGMVLAAAEELDLDLASSWLIGDTDADVETGLAAGCHVVLVETPGSTHKRAGRQWPGILHASGISTVANLVLGRLSG